MHLSISKNKNDKKLLLFNCWSSFNSFLFLTCLERTIFLLPITSASDLDLPDKTTIIYICYIITIENLFFGVSFIVMSVYKDLSKIKFTAWMIAIIMVARWAVILGSTLFRNKKGVTDTLTESLVIFVLVRLIILGVKKCKQ